MKIMSFNTQFCTNYLTKKIDFEIIAKAINICKPDIVGLNEMYDQSNMEEYDSQTKKLSSLTGLKYYKFAYACTLEEGTFGNAVLSRFPFEESRTIPIPEEEIKTGNQLYEPRCLLKIKYKNGLSVVITHFGLNHDEHINAVKTVLDNLEERKFVFMGDLNVFPDNEVLLPIKNKLNDTCIAFKERKLSFPSTVPDRKIDYIFVSKDIKILSADIPEIIASDHRPITAEIDF